MSRFHTTDFDLLPECAFQRRPGLVGAPRTLEGSKGTNVPAPDPRLVEAQIRSMGIQDDAITRIMSNAEALLPIQQEQMQFGLDASRQAFEQAQQDRGFILDRRGALSGVQDILVRDATQFKPEELAEKRAGQAVADVRQAFSNARGMTERGLSKYGLNPSDGRFAGMMNNLSVQEALAQAGAANTARDSARREGYALTDRAVNALAGYPAMGMQATGAGANYGASGLTLANTGLAGMNAGYQQAGALAGQMGSNATGMFGAQANYQTSMERASGDSFGNVLGGIGAAAGGLARLWPLMASDRRLKTGIVRVARDEHTGLDLYEFGYVGMDGRRFRGVMADEVERVNPQAVAFDDLGFASVDYRALGIEFVEVT